ncbi:uncharacterized protein LOC132201063 [Neocloeon triangulifer]|uniref:uncharacterized protein LOC132201063 n=1 Tax=Neocloeon triangulifer TaxID=2078957 RepID=UPI00286EE096|nr:uncharacterized protein LOC132201063 [Neocloeon triangulifer]XP_059482928.1 uncharacterized protein LOC132201063 [Neocloeon triangulifer]
MLQQFSPPAAVFMVSPPPQFAGGGNSPPKHFIWPEVQRQAKPAKTNPFAFLRANNNVLANNNKRKSAVEMLQESKAYYVKSEHVLDKKQVLRHSDHLRVQASPVLAARSNKHHRTASLDKVALLQENTPPPPRVPARSCSQSPPPLPPKSPRIAPGRPRAKTLVLPPVARNRQANCDVQMRLRQLLSHPDHTVNGYRRLSDDDASRIGHDDHVWLNEEDSNAFESRTVAGEKIYVSSRHSTPSAASRSLLSPVTHKSLPDLSPNKNGEDAASDTSSSNRCYYPSSRATSDYVSRSPSSCKCCNSRLRSPSEIGSAPVASDDDEKDELLSPNTDDSSRRRPVLRSKSDISYRYSKSAAFLAPVPRTEQEEQPIKTTDEVQQFFENLGLEEDVFKTLTRRGSHDSPVFFGSVSSVESYPGVQYVNNVPEAGEEAALGPGGSKMGEQPSIVERNARIIKWLCNCRKAQSTFS